MAAWPDLRNRADHLSELMDGPDADPHLLSRTYAQFPLINAVVSGARRLYRTEIRPHLSARSVFTVLDIGSGGGDIPRRFATWAARDGLRVRITAVDPDARAHAFASQVFAHDRFAYRGASRDSLEFLQTTSGQLVADGRTFDLVVSNHVLHHLEPEQLGSLMADSEALCRRAVVHSDIRRHLVAYLAFGLSTAPFFHRSYIRADGLTSIQRSFTPSELWEFAPPGWFVTTAAPYTLQLRYRRV